mmetsp:Transcript_30232/g.86638  ORF Transcript_30232/g.86638 Transcript_30232/m.86638 type:complete len:1324 (+) Transcript_30232:1-3972(+)
MRTSSLLGSMEPSPGAPATNDNYFRAMPAFHGQDTRRRNDEQEWRERSHMEQYHGTAATDDDYNRAMLAYHGQEARRQNEYNWLEHGQIDVSVGAGAASSSAAPGMLPPVYGTGYHGGQAAGGWQVSNDGLPDGSVGGYYDQAMPARASSSWQGAYEGYEEQRGPVSPSDLQRDMPPELMAPSPVAADGKAASPSSEEAVPCECDCEESEICRRIRLSKRLTSRPGLCVVGGLSAVVVVIAIGMAAMPMEIETDFDSFLKTDVESAIRRNAFIAAQESRAAYSRRLQGSSSDSGAVSYMSKDLFLAYELLDVDADSAGIFRSKAISAILGFEEALRSKPEWQALCGRTAEAHRDLCDPGVSFANYMLPTPEFRTSSIVPASLVMDGQGWEALPTRTAVMLAEGYQLDRLLLPTSVNSTVRGPLKSSAIRSAFRFKLPCCSVQAPLEEKRAAQEKFTQEWYEFSTNFLMPILRESLHEDSIRIWYQGSDYSDFEVKEALAGDFSLAIASLAFVCFYLLIHTRSVILSLLGPVIALLSVPLAYVICAMLFGATTVSFANFLALFLIVGFGADVIFVYTDCWRESAFHVENQDDAERLAWTFQRAAKASFATIATTALSFLANLASVIRALRQFGFFMGLCVMLAWVLISLIYTPLCVLDERLCRRWRTGRGLDGYKSRGFNWLANFLQRWQRTVLGVTLLMFFIFIGTAVPNVRQREDLPTIFPEDHNQNRGGEVFEQFASTTDTFGSKFQSPPSRALVCTGDNFTDGPGCHLYWCEASPYLDGAQAHWSGNGTCSCRRSYRSGCGDDPTAPVTVRLVGPQTLPSYQATAIAEYMRQSSREVSWAQLNTNREQIPALVLQEWETGLVQVERTVQVKAQLWRESLTSSSCGWNDLCFCGGALMCNMPGWHSVDQELRLPSESEANGRRLADDVSPGFVAPRPVPIKHRSKIRVIFGLEVMNHMKLLSEADPSESWDFKSGFDLRQPWAQRNVYFFCTNTPPELLVARDWCWMKDFRNYVNSQGMRFPVRADQFHEAALGFAERGSQSTRGMRYLWVVGSELKALYLSFEVHFKTSSSASLALEYKALWDEYLEKYNREAIRCARGAFHVSSVWVKAESQGELLSSTIQTMLILIVLAFLGMLAITRSLLLSSYVVAATVFVIAGLTFLIAVVMAWKIGIIEVIAIIYFIGYALDYSLHVAHKYTSSEALDSETTGEEVPKDVRFRRTRFALQNIGGAALGSAVTTAGASLFLTFCTLTIFKKLGGMCLTVTLISIITALGPLPALLLWAGPVHPGTGCAASCRRLRQLCGLGGESAEAGPQPRARE